MLIELKVSNFAIIENIHIQFGPGLNIMTGETGAGKSVLLKSLSLLMGLKGSTESIRTGFSQASIEGSFDVSVRPDVTQRVNELGIEIEEGLLVVKRVLAEGKSRVYINGTLSTLNTLRDLVSPLIEVSGHFAPLIELTGQFDNRNLVSKAYHLDLVDQAAKLGEQRLKYNSLYQEWKRQEAELNELKSADKSGAQRLDFLLYQRDEIEKLDLRDNEDIEIENDMKKLKNADRWSSFLATAEDSLLSGGDSAVDRLNSVLKKAHEFAGAENAVQESLDLLRSAKSQIEEALFAIQKWVDTIDSDPARLEELSQRMSDLRKLQKKYGTSVAEIKKAHLEIVHEIQKLQSRDDEIARLEKDLQKNQVVLKSMAQDLEQRRRKSAELLAKGVNSELADLNMKGMIFKIIISSLDHLTPTGSTEVEFMTQNSVKDEPRPLAKFASGGELSRVLLALKRVVGVSKQPRTYLFDEVDTGVSGPTAEKVGKKLHSIGQGQQVICITHLPQVAARGDSHFFIQKAQAREKSVSMEVTELKGKERVHEIARLISGETITKSSLTHAKELLQL